MKRVCILAAGLGLAAMASAQSPDITPTNLGVRAGFAYPLDNGTRDITHTLLGVGVDYYFPVRYIKDSDTYLSIDWLGKSGSGAKGNIFPIMLNQKFYSANQTYFGTRSYGFIGLGIAIVDVTSTKTTIAARLGFGVELGPNLFTEGAFVVSDDANGAKANSVGVYLGYRF